VLVGANRIGQSILDSLKSLNHEVVVVDFDPDIIKRLEGQNIDSFFGDITDLDIQEVAQLVSAKLVISTVPDIEDNLLLLKGVKKNKNRVKVIVVAQDDEEARQLYKEGADYVVLPHLAGGRHIAKIISENKIENIGRLR
ncbi:MAG: NAD-binding protein, partial [Candidatus Levybacteria bacterium]|nr:NAD-binding protein [Candidatus Levybacteria bacterium]